MITKITFRIMESLDINETFPNERHEYGKTSYTAAFHALRKHSDYLKCLAQLILIFDDPEFVGVDVHKAIGIAMGPEIFAAVKVTNYTKTRRVYQIPMLWIHESDS